MGKQNTESKLLLANHAMAKRVKDTETALRWANALAVWQHRQSLLGRLLRKSTVSRAEFEKILAAVDEERAIVSMKYEGDTLKIEVLDAEETAAVAVAKAKAVEASDA